MHYPRLGIHAVAPLAGFPHATYSVAISRVSRMIHLVMIMMMVAVGSGGGGSDGDDDEIHDINIHSIKFDVYFL